MNEPRSSGVAPDDAVVDLLGLLAYVELVAFFRLSQDAERATTVADQAALGEIAAAQFANFRRLRDHLTAIGADAERAMEPFVAAVAAFHANTEPRDWLEGVVKAYVGDGIGADFYRGIALRVDPPTRALVNDVLADTGRTQFAVDHVRAAIAATPALADRLSLWARRIVGEALSQAQRVAAEHPSLAALVSGADGEQGMELGAVGRLFAALADEHARRMTALGLSG